MGSVLKGHKYRLVDNRSFELPLPLKYVLLKEDTEIAEYAIGTDENVDYTVLTKFKEDMLTPIYRKLSISDIYYFFSTRVFQDKTPFTFHELSLLGMEKYNVYEIIRKTRGITPYDTYWIKFDGDKCDYDEARKHWDELMSMVHAPEKEEPKLSKKDPTVKAILNQHKLDYSARLAAAEAEKAAEPAPSEESSGGKMSQEDIEKMLAAAATAAEPEPVPEAPDPESEKPSGGKMSQEDIEKMLAAATAAAEPEPVPEAPVAEPEKPSGGKMSQEDIEKMLAAATAAAEPEPVPEAPVSEPEKPSGGKMSQEDIEKMLAAATAAAEPEPVPEAPAPEPEKPSGGKMSQDDIERLLNGMKDDAT